MGTLIYGRDLCQLTHAVWTHNAPSQGLFGVTPHAHHGEVSSVRDWMIDHAALPGPVMGREACLQLILSLRQKALQTQQGAHPPTPHFAELVYSALLLLASDGLGAEDVARWATLSALRDTPHARALEGIAETLRAITATCAAQGVHSRFSLFNALLTLPGAPFHTAPVGVLLEFPGSVGAQLLMRAVRLMPQARLGLVHDVDEGARSQLATLFLQHAVSEHYQVGEQALERAPEEAQRQALQLQTQPLHTLEEALGVMAQHPEIDLIVQDALSVQLLGHLAPQLARRGQIALFPAIGPHQGAKVLWRPAQAGSLLPQPWLPRLLAQVMAGRGSASMAAMSDAPSLTALSSCVVDFSHLPLSLSAGASDHPSHRAPPSAETLAEAGMSASVNCQKLSVSELLDYVQCPHRLYLKRKIGLIKEVREASDTLAAHEWGSVIHEALAQVLKPLQKQPLNDALIAGALESLPGALLTACGRYKPAKALSAQERYQLSYVQGRLSDYLRQDLQTLRAAGGEIYQLESQIEWEQQGITLHGRIDRIDRIHEPTGDRYSLWELKSGQIPTSLSEAQNLQLWIYILATGASAVAQASFAAVLKGRYFGVGALPHYQGKEQGIRPLTSGWEPHFEHWQSILQSALTGLSQGLLHPAPLEGACERCRYKNLCKPTPPPDELGRVSSEGE